MDRLRRGRILQGINNIFTVLDGEVEAECRIKGKILGGEKEEYNPLAPGDWVEWLSAPGQEDKGLIVRRLERHSQYQRWNRKGKRLQTLAANVDLVLLLTAADAHHFRPRFVDRGLVLAHLSGLEAAVVVNKIDLEPAPQLSSRCEAWRSIGITVFTISALQGWGLEGLRTRLQGHSAVLVGQSGVGKSTLLNALIPSAAQKTAALSRKYDRGVHATTCARLFLGEGFDVIDTPGVRELELPDLEARDVQEAFPEILRLRAACQYPGCTHREEPQCAVREAVLAGDFHPDRYESYLRLYDELAARDRYG